MSKLQKAFTLIELMIVIGIMAVIAAGVVATINPQQKILQARDSQTQNAVGQVATALQSSAALDPDGFYPALVDDLVPEELTVLPALNGEVFTYQGGGTNAVSLSVPMQADRNIAQGALWCWRSNAGVAGFAAACAP